MTAKYHTAMAWSQKAARKATRCRIRCASRYRTSAYAQSGSPNMISIWNSTAYWMRGGASVKTSIATAAASWRRVIQNATAYIAHPDAAQKRSSVTLYAR